MKYIDVDFHVPYENFALEEYLLNEAPEGDYVFFYIHQPAIIVGKFQNTLEEINQSFVDDHQIIVARRLSGGGAVYHDKGNLNFSFVQKANTSDVNNFSKFTQPVIEGLNRLGVKAELSGRNDLVVGDKKISGNAQCYANGRLLHHGTLLFDADMSHLSDALNVKPIKVVSKGIKSVRSRVDNIINYLDEPMTIETFRSHLLDFFGESKSIEKLTLSPEILAKIQKRASEHFASWEWNWRKSPKYTLEKTGKFSCGILDIKLDIQDGLIHGIKIYGDFFTWKNLELLEKKLTGLAYRKETLTNALSEMNLSDYFKSMSNAEFIDFLMNA